jgi:hypothetical protein
VNCKGTSSTAGTACQFKGSALTDPEIEAANIAAYCPVRKMPANGLIFRHVRMDPFRLISLNIAPVGISVGIKL